MEAHKAKESFCIHFLYIYVQTHLQFKWILCF